jgi:hypothetical protein
MASASTIQRARVSFVFPVPVCGSKTQPSPTCVRGGAGRGGASVAQFSSKHARTRTCHTRAGTRTCTHAATHARPHPRTHARLREPRGRRTTTASPPRPRCFFEHRAPSVVCVVQLVTEIDFGTPDRAEGASAVSGGRRATRTGPNKMAERLSSRRPIRRAHRARGTAGTACAPHRRRWRGRRAARPP